MSLYKISKSSTCHLSSRNFALVLTMLCTVLRTGNSCAHYRAQGARRVETFKPGVQ